MYYDNGIAYISGIDRGPWKQVMYILYTQARAHLIEFEKRVFTGKIRHNIHISNNAYFHFFGHATDPYTLVMSCR